MNVSEDPPTQASAPSPARPPAPARPAIALDSGEVTVSEMVVAKIASVAAQEVDGVHALGVGAARTVTSVRDRIPGAGAAAPTGVSVEVGKTQTAIDLDIIVEYGTPITEIARDVRRHVISTVEELTGLQVVEVNVTVDDVYLPASATDTREARLR